jgi:hypothetical protein
LQPEHKVRQEGAIKDNTQHVMDFASALAQGNHAQKPVRGFPAQKFEKSKNF